MPFIFPISQYEFIHTYKWLAESAIISKTCLSEFQKEQI